MRITTARQAGQAVKDARLQVGLTQIQLAELAHVSTRLISSLELGDSPGIQLDKLLAIFGALDLELSVDGGRGAASVPDLLAPAGEIAPPVTEADTVRQAASSETNAARHEEVRRPTVNQSVRYSQDVNRRYADEVARRFGWVPWPGLAVEYDGSEGGARDDAAKP